MSKIDARYLELGGASGILGAAKAPEQSNSDGSGKFRHFKNGSIYWHPLTGVFEVYGAIRAKWAKLGWEQSAEQALRATR